MRLISEAILGFVMVRAEVTVRSGEFSAGITGWMEWWERAHMHLPAFRGLVSVPVPP